MIVDNMGNANIKLQPPKYTLFQKVQLISKLIQIPTASVDVMIPKQCRTCSTIEFGTTTKTLKYSL